MSRPSAASPDRGGRTQADLPDRRDEARTCRPGEGGGSPQIVTHQFEPVFDPSSRALVLGTMPSPKSREAGFYYGHPRNRFWPILADVFGEPVPVTIGEKTSLALRHHLAVWDVLASCEICGADDSSIRRPVANDMRTVMDHARIEAVFTTGSKAAALYRRHCLPLTGMSAICLPSTSPANCRMSYEELLQAYRQLRRFG